MAQEKREIAKIEKIIKNKYQLHENKILYISFYVSINMLIDIYIGYLIFNFRSFLLTNEKVRQFF